MRVVALLAVRNEEIYLERCLQHLATHGIETCLIDNDSTDATRDIANTFLDKGLFRIETLPYEGYFDWVGLLRLKQKLASEISADWFIHHDADEVREPPGSQGRLCDAMVTVDGQGYSAINFDEFVFVPVSGAESFVGTDYVKAMRHYYYFQPEPLWRVNAWKKTDQPVDLVNSGGHRVEFRGRHVCPVNFVLRHYVVLSREHAISKYIDQRVYSRSEVEERGWHRGRADFHPSRLRLPLAHELKCVDTNGWDTTRPLPRHLFLGERMPE